jgi:hypothetical protein
MRRGRCCKNCGAPEGVLLFRGIADHRIWTASLKEVCADKRFNSFGRRTYLDDDDLCRVCAPKGWMTKKAG